MKTKELEEMLSNQVMCRLNKLEDDEDAYGSYKMSDEARDRLMSEIARLNAMRSGIHSDRMDRIQKYIETGIRTAVPAIVTVTLAMFGYGLEGLFGNACSKTLQGVVSRSPKM